MRFWIAAPLIYVAALAIGLLIPASVIWLQHPRMLFTGSIYTLDLLVLAAAAAVLALMVARVIFPQYWWLGQVMGQDVYEIQGVFFIGVRLARVPDRLQRLLFGAGEKLRRWDIAFGLIWLLLTGAHILAASTSHRAIENLLPRPVRLPETLNEAFFSDLPVMRALQTPWSPDPRLAKILLEQFDRLQDLQGKSEADWFKLAQLQILRAYRVRKGLADAYAFTPMDTIFFERGVGAQAADDLNQILAVPEAKRAPITRGTLTLLGFYYLCEYNPEKAVPPLTKALALGGAADRSGISLAWTRMVAAQAALQLGDSDTAATQLGQVLGEPGLPTQLQGLVLEHLAEAKRLGRERSDVDPLLDKAGALYGALGDGGGQARVSLRRAVWLVDQGRPKAGAEALSQASALAQTAGDPFARNMVVRVTHLLPALR